MAAGSVLRSAQLIESEVESARALLAGASLPDVGAARARASAWCADRLRRALAACGDFDGLRPIIIGSWARGELCPRSDADVVFLGPEPLVAAFVARAFKAGLKLRARVPEDPRDLGRGVDPFDLLALADVGARAPSKAERRVIQSAVRRERDDRRARQDSIINFLEPNLKFGPGGLRDIQQALALSRLYPERFVDADPYAFTALRDLKDEFLFLRTHLHLNGAGDVLTAADQHDLAARLKMSVKDLTRHVQSELERASFYADWIVAVTSARGAAVRPPVRSPAAVIAALDEDQSMPRQYEIRRAGRAPFRNLDDYQRGALLKRALDRPVSDEFIVALYRTRVLERILPELKNLRGLVQHDHYHRFTADAHLVQTLRETQRAESRPRGLGTLRRRCADLKRKDWWTLKLTALFHDLAKGGTGDHATAGARLVERHFEAWGYPAELMDDVRWLVEHHLILSTAAFRQNPRAPATWRRLFERGVGGRRLTLLAIFTAIDIRATNPDAWTEWKAKLLTELVDTLESPPARGLDAGLRLAPHFGSVLLDLDPALLESLSPRVLTADLSRVADANGDAAPFAVRAGGRLWVRLHARVDRPGLFLDFVERLFGFGLSVQMCFATTHEDVGAYDWFCIKGDRTPKQVMNWLCLPVTASSHVASVTFQSVDLTATQPEWIFSCRGRDQRGLLVSAARALASAGLSIKWARVHTWGLQVEDVFGVEPAGTVDDALLRLRSRLVPT